MAEGPGVAVDNHPDPQSEDEHHGRTEQRADQTQAADESGHVVGLIASKGLSREQRKGDESTDPNMAATTWKKMSQSYRLATGITISPDPSWTRLQSRSHSSPVASPINQVLSRDAVASTFEGLGTSVHIRTGFEHVRPTPRSCRNREPCVGCRAQPR